MPKTGRAAAIEAQMAKLAAPATPAPTAPMPAETPGRARYSERIPFTTTPEQKRALELARVDDGIQATARLRALVQLWMQDKRLRNRVNKLARTLR